MPRPTVLDDSLLVSLGEGGLRPPTPFGDREEVAERPLEDVVYTPSVVDMLSHAIVENWARRIVDELLRRVVQDNFPFPLFPRYGVDAGYLAALLQPLLSCLLYTSPSPRD